MLLKGVADPAKYGYFTSGYSLIYNYNMARGVHMHQAVIVGRFYNSTGWCIKVFPLINLGQLSQQIK